jgi:hypothetical protein
MKRLRNVARSRARRGLRKKRRLANWHQVDPNTASAFGADEEGEVQA